MDKSDQGKVAHQLGDFYHGSPQSGLRAVAARPEGRQFDNATSQFGAFVTDDPEYAQRYAGMDGTVYKASLVLQKPYAMDFAEFNKFQSPNRDTARRSLPPERWEGRLEELKQEATALRSRLEAEGYDGIVISGSGLRPTEVASFRDIALRPIELPENASAPSDSRRANPEEAIDRLLALLPVKYDPYLANDATVRSDGIRVGPSFLAKPPAARRTILIHEMAHLRGLDDWYLYHHEDWDLAAKSDFGHLNGQTTPGEIMVEAYAMLWIDPAFLAQHAPELIPIIETGARAVGLPLPRERQFESDHQLGADRENSVELP